MVSLFVSLRAFPTALSHEATCCEWAASFCDTPPPAAAGKGKDEKYRLPFTAPTRSTGKSFFSFPAALNSLRSHTDALNPPRGVEVALGERSEDPVVSNSK